MSQNSHKSEHSIISTLQLCRFSNEHSSNTEPSTPGESSLRYTFPGAESLEQQDCEFCYPITKSVGKYSSPTNDNTWSLAQEFILLKSQSTESSTFDRMQQHYHNTLWTPPTEIIIRQKKETLTVVCPVPTAWMTVIEFVEQYECMKTSELRQLLNGLVKLVVSHPSEPHYNITPSTVFVDPNNLSVVSAGPKLPPLEEIDFHKASWAHASMYLAPELIRGTPAGKKSDMWGVGIVMGYAACGQHPFETDPATPASPIDVMMKMGGGGGGGKILAPLNFASSSVKRFLEDCLQYDPELRPLPEESLIHSFSEDDGVDMQELNLFPMVSDAPAWASDSVQRNYFGAETHNVSMFHSILMDDDGGGSCTDTESQDSGEGFTRTTWGTLYPRLVKHSKHVESVQDVLSYVSSNSPVPYQEYLQRTKGGDEDTIQCAIQETLLVVKNSMQIMNLQSRVGETLVFGRSSHCAFVLKDKSVSVEHFAIIRYPNDVTILENRSKKGTYVNSTKITTRISLKTGDTIEVGKRYIGYVFCCESGGVSNVSTRTTLRPDEKFMWQKGNALGSGTTATVYLGLDLNSGRLIAAKEFPLHKLAKDVVTNIMHEIVLLKDLKHENVVTYLGTEHSDKVLYLFMEYVPGGTLANLVKKFGRIPESVVRLYTLQLLLGIDYLHSKNVVHGDIKGANILITDQGNIRLADFGGSCILTQYCEHHHRTCPHSTEHCDGVGLNDEYCKANKLGLYREKPLDNEGQEDRGVTGTPLYMSPETIRLNSPTFTGDVWSLGCVVLEMLGFQPWREKGFNSVPQALYAIASCKKGPTLPSYEELQADNPADVVCLHDFLSQCFILDPHLRPNAKELLSHDFVTSAAKAKPIEKLELLEVSLKE